MADENAPKYNKNGIRLCDDEDCEDIATNTFALSDGWMCQCSFHAYEMVYIAADMGHGTPSATLRRMTMDEMYPEENRKKEFAIVFKHCIDIGYHQVPEKDYDFWAVAFHSEDNETIYRKDADKDEIQRMFSDPDKYCKVWREFQTTKKPKYWVVWPHSVSKDWCERITGNL